MKLSWLAPAVLLTSFAHSAQAVEVSGTVTFTNDYRFHGITQTAGDAAVQGSVDLAFDNGAFAGVWGSNVDFGDDANLEIDYYGGYAGSLTDELGYAVTLFYFQYPGYDAADIDFFEVDLQLFYKGATLTYAIAPDYVNSGEDGNYLALDYSMGITDQVNLDLHAGHSFGNYWDGFDIGGYSDFSVGVSTSFSGLDISAAYLFNDVDTDVDKGVGRNDNTLQLMLSRTF